MHINSFIPKIINTFLFNKNMDEKEITSEQLDKFIEFAFEKFKKEEDAGDHSKQKIKNLFILSTIQFRNIRNAKVRQGTKNVFVDFPHAASYAIKDLYLICNKKAEHLPIRAKTMKELNEMEKECKRFVERFRKEKANPEKAEGKLFNILSQLGINWVIYCRLQQLIIKYEVEKYYQTLWKDKIKQFIEEWKKGNDSLLTLYRKIRLLTVEYRRFQNVEGRKRPYITMLLLEKNDYLSIRREMEQLENFFMKTKKYIKKNREHSAYRTLAQTLMDIKTSIHQIRHVLSSGYCFTSFILLRKLIESFGTLLFVHSVPYHVPEIEEKFSAMEISDKKWIELIEKWVSSFKSDNEWFPVSLSGDAITSDSLLKNKINKKYERIRSIKHFKDLIKKYGKNYCIFKKPINAGGTFLTEQLDVIRTYGEDAYTYAQSGKEIPKENKEIYEEYRTLCDIVHEPIYIDYPPFASFIEYLSFLHHLRKIRFLLQETFHIYTHLF